MQLTLTVLTVLPGLTRHEQSGCLPSPGTRPAPHWAMRVWAERFPCTPL